MKKIIRTVLIVLITVISINAQNTDSLSLEKEKSYFIPSNLPNLVLNPGFEQLNSNNLPLDWSGDNKLFSIDKTVSRSGTYSLKYDNSDPNYYKTYYQNLNLIPGHKYKFSVYVKTKNIIGQETGATICLQWNDKNGNWKGGSYPPGIKGTNDWTYIEGEAEIPGDIGSSAVFCYVRKGMTGQAWFDDVEVKEIFKPSVLSFFQYPKYRGVYRKNETKPVTIKTKLEDFVINLDKLKLNYLVQNKNSFKIIGNQTFYPGSEKTNIFSFDPKNLDLGDYNINISIINNSDNKIIEHHSLQFKIVPDNYSQTVYIDDSLRTIVNGKPFFPIGMYFWTINENDLKIFSDSKFNCLMPYPNTTLEQMDLAAKYNLKVVYSIKDDFSNLESHPKEIKNVIQEEEYIKNKIEEIKNHKALLAWYIADELKPEMIPQMKAHYDLLCQLDKNHPAWAVLNNVDQINKYINTFDIIGSDPYPVNYDKISRVTDYTLRTNSQINSLKPLWMVIQAHNLGVYPNAPKNPRAPTYEEMRNMAWQSICEGAKGIFFYSFFDLKKDPDQPFVVQWNNLKEIAAEIYKYSQIVLSIDKVPNININSSQKPIWFHYLAKSKDGILYIFAVDDGDGKGNINFELNQEIKQITELNEGKQIYFNSNKFNDDFQNYNFKIYKIELK